MFTVLPPTQQHTFPRAPRAQLMADLLLAEDHKEQTMTALEEILGRRSLSALFQPIIDLKRGEFLGYEGLIRGPANSPLHSPVNLFRASLKIRFNFAHFERCAFFCNAGNL